MILNLQMVWSFYYNILNTRNIIFAKQDISFLDMPSFIIIIITYYHYYQKCLNSIFFFINVK